MEPLSQKEAFWRQVFGSCQTWEDKYAYVIQLGKIFPPYPKSELKDIYRVKGCASPLWLYPQKPAQGSGLEWLVYSEALISKGLAALVALTYGWLSAADVLNHDIQFWAQLGLWEGLTPQRVGGFRSMIQTCQRWLQLMELSKGDNL